METNDKPNVKDTLRELTTKEEIQKPTKKAPVKDMLDYYDMIAYIQKKYKVEVRDYHKTYPKDKKDYRDYMDFWHWLDGVTHIANDSAAYLNIKEWLESDTTPPWIKEILNMMKTEFQEHFDTDGGLEVWISW